MVVDDFDICRSAVRESEADAPLTVDADAVLPHPISFEHFQLISRGDFQEVQVRRRMQLLQFAHGPALDISEARYSLAGEEHSRVTTPKGSDH